MSRSVEKSESSSFEIKEIIGAFVSGLILYVLMLFSGKGFGNFVNVYENADGFLEVLYFVVSAVWFTANIFLSFSAGFPFNLSRDFNNKTLLQKSKVIRK